MPRRDLYHDLVVKALESEGWTITDDPLQVSIGDTDLYVDLAAERVLGAVKDEVKIAVEIKSFLGASKVDDLEMAVGQYKCLPRRPGRGSARSTHLSCGLQACRQRHLE